jgi:uncharacterized membrane protein (UPF0127 family)
MTVLSPRGQAFNRTRQTCLATELSLADTHWLRLRGLVGASEQDFRDGCGLWIVPCRGVHTFAMSFPIDALYLNRDGIVVHVERKLQPWRFAPVRMQAATVLELPSGKAVETETAVGDKIEINLEKDLSPGKDQGIQPA